MKINFKNILILVFALTLLLSVGNKANAEWRSGFSFGEDRMGIKLIEYFRTNNSFYLDLKTERKNEEKAITRLGHRRYLDKNNGPFVDLSVVIKEDQGTTDEGEVGFGVGGGYVYQLSDSWFLNVEGGYNTADSDFYVGGSIDWSWSNLISKLEITSLDIKIESSRKVQATPGSSEEEDDDIEETDDLEEEERDHSEIKRMQEGIDYFVYEGRGNEYIKLSEEYKTGILALHGNLGTRNSSVIGYNEGGDKTENIIDDGASYRGRELMYFKPKAETMHLEIELPGNWQLISLPQISRIDDIVKPPVEISGTGNELIAIKGEPSVINIEANQKGDYFEVIMWYGNVNKRSIVETTDPYNDSIKLPQSGVYILEVIAFDEWKIGLE
ncbi:hypothetical protein [Fuchsiella alkaliacetigena]|uniref:hypothetical protein n=1 Tax=Fuchsiella alkaliacetigena TaxID=957042 RepID=UPI00200B1E62|nr:hypothetical protein [Fuchsiella alkaliacetigena]MCK8826051.1 hypothetical protein [Fuchsiella alkaliacetigena]